MKFKVSQKLYRKLTSGVQFNYIYNTFQHELSSKPLSIGIIGSGPAGLYSAKKLFAEISNLNIHIYDKEVFPTGLIRYGMAPDHEKIKKVADDLLSVSHQRTCKFFGGVEIGKDLSYQDLVDNYSALIFAYGAQFDRNLGIPGENIQGVYSGRQIVNWYNSLMDQNFNLNLSNVRDLVIIGNGNVTIDLARVLGQPIERLQKTDVDLDALDAIKKRKIQNIHIVGRRGIVQSAFSLKELRELTKIEGFEFYLYKPDLIRSLNENSYLEAMDQGKYFGNETRANRRKLEFMNSFNIIENKEQLDKLVGQDSEKIKIIFRFLLNPIEITKQDETLSMKFNVSNLTGEPFKQRSVQTMEYEEIQSQMIIKSVGYRSINIDQDLPWDFQRDILNHQDGCLLKDNKIAVGQYAAGWIKTGPVGVIDATFASSMESIVNMKNHITNQIIQPKQDPYEYINKTLLDKNVRCTSFEDWQRLDIKEKELGKQLGKTRLKFKQKSQVFNFLNGSN